MVIASLSSSILIIHMKKFPIYISNIESRLEGILLTTTPFTWTLTYLNTSFFTHQFVKIDSNLIN